MRGGGGIRQAFHALAGYYANGVMGVPQDFAKANELYLGAGELGSTEAYSNLGISYENGDSVEVDKKKLTITMSLQL